MPSPTGLPVSKEDGGGRKKPVRQKQSTKSCKLYGTFWGVGGGLNTGTDSKSEQGSDAKNCASSVVFIGGGEGH